MKRFRLFFLVIVFAFSVCLSSTAETLAWWRFEEGTVGNPAESVRDWGADGNSMGNFPGVIVGAPIYESAGDYNLVNGLANNVGLDFNGFDDYVADIPGFPITAADTFTCEAIVKWYGLLGTAVNHIFQQADSSGTGRTILSIDTNNKLQTYIGGSAFTIEDVDIPIDEWIYMGVTYDAGVLALWLDIDLSDGIQPKSYFNVTERNFEDNDGGFFIGTHKSLANNFFGVISEIRVTDAGIGEYDISVKPPFESWDVVDADADDKEPQAETIAWWRFEEGEVSAEPDDIQDFGADGNSTGDFKGLVTSGFPYFVNVDAPRTILPGKLMDSMALEFNGIDDHFETGLGIGVNADSQFTIESIIKWFGLNGHNNMIMQQGDGVGTGRSWLFVADADSTLRSYIGGATTQILDPVVPVDQWIYAAVTYDKGQVVVWMDTDLSDGIQPSSHYAVTSLTMEENDGVIFIGNHKSSDNHFWGQISEVRITRSGFGGGEMTVSAPAESFTLGTETSIPIWELF